MLFLWVSSPLLDDCISVGKSWSFNYITVAFVWHKQAPLSGYYTLSDCELCLVFKKGKIPQPRGARNIRQFMSIKKGKHSQKPKEARNRILKMFPTQRKIELFAREIVPYWAAWGNEVNKTDHEESNIILYEQSKLF